MPAAPALLLALTLLLSGCDLLGRSALNGPGLEVTALGKTYAPDPERVGPAQRRADGGGSTSVRNVDAAHLEWKASGYYQRNRDLGQVFTPERDLTLRAVVLRIGPSDSGVLAGAPGAPLFLQFFEVAGEPRIDDNGTPPGAEATHGFTTNHRADDFITGVRYAPLALLRGGVFPQLAPTSAATAADDGRLTYLRWRLVRPLRFKAGRRYAFMVGFEQPGPERGFTLANQNAAAEPDPGRLGDRHDHYGGGWGLRREGDGSAPPTMRPAPAAPEGGPLRARLVGEALFAGGAARYALAPTTDGYPDVDTYRDLYFVLETAP